MIFLLLLLAAGCTAVPTAKKDSNLEFEPKLELFSPMPAELVSSYLLGVSTNTPKNFIFLNKKAYFCNDSSCPINIEDFPSAITIEIVRPTKDGFLYYSPSTYKKSLFYKSKEGGAPINLLRPSALVLPILRNNIYYLDCFISPGVADPDYLDLKISGSISFDYKYNSIEIPVISDFPLSLHVKLTHKKSKEIMEEFDLKINKEDFIHEDTP